MANEKRLTWKRNIDGFEDVGLCDGVTVGDAICKLADLEERETVEEVHARWEDVWGGKYANKKYRCSVCRGKALYDTVQDSLGNWSAEQKLTPICPHCGAKMDGGNEDEI